MRTESLSFINTRQPGCILHIMGEKLERAMDMNAKNRLTIPLLVGEDATTSLTQLAISCS